MSAAAQVTPWSGDGQNGMRPTFCGATQSTVEATPDAGIFPSRPKCTTMTMIGPDSSALARLRTAAVTEIRVGMIGTALDRERMYIRNEVVSTILADTFEWRPRTLQPVWTSIHTNQRMGPLLPGTVGLGPTGDCPHSGVWAV